jgi:hypothetical protein
MKIIIHNNLKLMFLSALFALSLSCQSNNNGVKNEPTVAMANVTSVGASSIVGKWLMYASADFMDTKQKPVDADFKLFDNTHYDAMKSSGYTGEIVFSADGTFILTPTEGKAEVLKWRIKSDGIYQMVETNSTTSADELPISNDDIMYLDAKGELIIEAEGGANSLGVTTKVYNYVKCKRN